MTKKARLFKIVLMTSTMFGLFFGAGNLIFPIQLGQNSGEKLYSTLGGFIVSGVGFTCLAVFACIKSGEQTLEGMLQSYGSKYATLFTAVLLLTIGPLFAIPRTATVPYEVGIRSNFAFINHSVGMGLFSLLFFIVSGLMALKPSKMNDYIGKVINPLFLLCLFVFFITFMISPISSNINFTSSESYLNNPIIKGFEDGYQTMDTLAALIFGFVVINSSVKPNESNKKADLYLSVVIAGVLMGTIYFILSLIGASSRAIMDISPNGGIALGLIFKHYFGDFGSLFLLITISLACLKTSVGLITAVATFMSHTFDKISYSLSVLFITIISFVISNMGLSTIVELSIPVLKILYPLAIMHVMVQIVFVKLSKYKSFIIPVLIATVSAVIIEFLCGVSFLKEFELSKNIVNIFNQLPLANFGLSWINFTVCGILVGFVAYLVVDRSALLKKESM